MHRLAPLARVAAVVAASSVLGVALPVSAGQTETRRPGVAVDDGDSAPEPSGDVDEGRVRRRVRSPIRDPWSAGVRVLWGSLGGGSRRGGGLPPATGGGLPVSIGSSPPVILGSCSAGGACSPNGNSQRAGALGGATSGNGSPVQGVAFDAGRLITAGVEVGMGLDLTTHPGEALLSTRPGGVFGNASPKDAALEVLTGERALQLDLAARLTYRPRVDDPGSYGGVPLATPYVGIGAGMSRYFAGFSSFEGRGVDGAPLAPSGTASPVVNPWIPNLQIYGGFLVSLNKRMAPILEIDFRYMRAATRGLDLGGFRIGTGVRYPF